MTPLTFACAEPDCSSMVNYEPQLIPYVTARRVRRVSGRALRIYLVCEHGHLHPYRVQVPSDDD